MQIDPFLILSIAVLIVSAAFHEVAHGYAAYLLGDPTAKHQGRLTLNPLKHLDPIGSVLLPAVLLIVSRGAVAFGWAKPVPYNPYNLKDQRWGELKVALAGPLTNIVIAVAAGLGLRALAAAGGPDSFGALLLATIVLVNLVLAVFNLIPIPPLDGSKILFAFLPYNMQEIRGTLENMSIFLIFFVIFFAWDWIYPIVPLLFDLIVRA